MKKLSTLLAAVLFAAGLFAQEINVRSREMTLVDGDASPSTVDNTDFGRQYVTTGTLTKVFTVQNLGASSLTLGTVTVGGTHGADFTVSTQPSGSVPAGGSTTFTVVFDPSATGTRSATLSLATNDADENPFNFSIQGTGFAAVNARWVNNSGGTRPATVVVNGLTYNVVATTYTTIQSAISAATADEVVYVTNGTYTNASENGSNTNCNIAGLAQDLTLYLQVLNKTNVTITSETGDYCTSSALLVGYGFMLSGGSQNTIQGFQMSNVRVNAFWNTNTADGYFMSLDNKIKNNKVSGTRGHGLKTDTGIPGELSRGAWEITGNYFENIGFFNGTGACPTPLLVSAIWLGEAGANFYIANNTINNTRWAGILCDGFGGTTSGSPAYDGVVVITGNKVSNTVDAGIQIGFSSANFYYPTNAFIHGNIVTNANTHQELGIGGITLLASNVRGISVKGNDVSASYNGIVVDIAGWDNSFDIKNFNDNNVYSLTGGSFGFKHFAGYAPNCLCGTQDDLLKYNLENNYWGAYSGPTYTTNPGGTGVTLKKETVAQSGTIYSLNDFDFSPFRMRKAGPIFYEGTGFGTCDAPVAVTRYAESGGTYASSGGLSLNAATGQITPSTSTPGTYTVTYTVGLAGTCSGIVYSTTVDILSQATHATLATAAMPALTQGCTESNGWTYYSDPTDDSRLLFGIHWDPTNIGGGHNSAAKAAATVSIGYNDAGSATNGLSGAARQSTWTMSRYWNVNTGGNPLDGNVNVRFFYLPAEKTSIETLKAIEVGNGAPDEGFTWFKTEGQPFDPSNTTILNANRILGIPLTDVSGGATLNGVSYAQFNGISSFSGGTGAAGVGPGGTPLPIELIAFEGTSKGTFNALSWTTASETNNDRFEVERSNDAVEFVQVGQVKGAGNSTTAQHYAFNDLHPENRLNYYRLRQVDTDGTARYSSVLAIASISSPFAVYPNPTQDNITLAVGEDAFLGTRAFLFDEAGRLLETLTLTKPFQAISLENYASGVYLLKLSNSEVFKVFKL